MIMQEGMKPRFHQLDIDSVESIKKFANHLKQTHGGIDILVNNAAIAFKVRNFFERKNVRLKYYKMLFIINYRRTAQQNPLQSKLRQLFV